MKLNGIEIGISEYIEELIDDEIVIFQEKTKKIIVLNQTAMLIWNKICENYLVNTNINTIDIARVLLKKYDLPQSEINIICEDIDETIELLFQAALLQRVS